MVGSWHSMLLLQLSLDQQSLVGVYLSEMQLSLREISLCELQYKNVISQDIIC